MINEQENEVLYVCFVLHQLVLAMNKEFTENIPFFVLFQLENK